MPSRGVQHRRGQVTQSHPQTPPPRTSSFSFLKATWTSLYEIVYCLPITKRRHVLNNGGHFTAAKTLVRRHRGVGWGVEGQESPTCHWKFAHLRLDGTHTQKEESEDIQYSVRPDETSADFLSDTEAFGCEEKRAASTRFEPATTERNAKRCSFPHVARFDSVTVTWHFFFPRRENDVRKERILRFKEWKMVQYVDIQKNWIKT